MTLRVPVNLALAFGILCIGFSGIFVKLAGQPGSVTAFYRMLFAGIVVVPWWLATAHRKVPAVDLGLIVTGGIFFALDIVLWNASLLLLPASTATLLANNAPLWLGLVSFFWSRERLPGTYWLGLTVALGGMVVLTGSRALAQVQADAGNILAVGSGILYSVFLLTTQSARMRVDLLSFMAISTLSSITTLFLVNVALGASLGGFSTKVWLALAGLGLISQLGGWIAINYALGSLRAATVSVWLLGQAVVTAVAAMPMLGEFMTVHQMLGGVLILAGIRFVTIAKSGPDPQRRV